MRTTFKFLLLSIVFCTNSYFANAINSSTSIKPLVETYSDIVTPTITVSGPLTNFTTCSGSASASQTFTVSGSDLSANIVITAPVGYEISINGTSGWVTTTLTLPQTSGIVSSTTIYIRIAATTTTITNVLTISIASIQLHLLLL